MRSLLLATTCLALATATASAVEVKAYGLVDKAFMTHDDGQTTESSIVDNNLESTRFGLAGEQKLDNGLTASVLFEVENASNPSSGITQAGTGINHSQANTPASSFSGISERMARVGLAGSFGAVFLGQQDVATDDAGFHDIAAATSVMNPNFAAFGGGLHFRTKTGTTYGNLTAGGSNLTPGLMALGWNGATDTADSIRYNSPDYNGFNGSASVSQGGNIDATARYAAELGDLSVDGAIGNKWVNDNVTTATDELQTQLTASASVKHKSGIGATLAYIQQGIDHKSTGVEDPSGWYAKLGYAWSSYGLAVDYAKFKNADTTTSTDHEMTSLGLGGEYDMGQGVTLGALFRNYNAKVTGITNDKPIDVGAVNMKVKF